MNTELSKYDPMHGIPKESVKEKINYMRASYNWHKDECFLLGGIEIGTFGKKDRITSCYFIEFTFGIKQDKNLYDRIIVGQTELKELNLPKITDLFTTPIGNKHLINYIMGNEASLIKD